MPSLPIRSDLSSTELRRLARAERDGRVARRLLAIANALEGMSRSQAARLAGMDRQTLRDWVIRYNEAGAKGRSDRWGTGFAVAVSEGELAVVKDFGGLVPFWRCRPATADRGCGGPDRSANRCSLQPFRRTQAHAHARSILSEDPPKPPQGRSRSQSPF